MHINKLKIYKITNYILMFNLCLSLNSCTVENFNTYSTPDTFTEIKPVGGPAITYKVLKKTK